MNKIKIGKIIVISFIGLIVTLFVGLGGNITLNAGLPASDSRSEVNFENRLQTLEDNLVSGTISRIEYDSIIDVLHAQKTLAEALQDESHTPYNIPEWVTRLGISAPNGMKYDQIFSSFTSIDDPSEGFNSVSLIYTGSYDVAVSEAERIAANASLSIAGNLKAKGRPVKKDIPVIAPSVNYLNYSLEDADKDFLISVQVESSGRLIIMVTDNKQLKYRLLAYEPLNNRLKSAANLKK